MIRELTGPGFTLRESSMSDFVVGETLLLDKPFGMQESRVIDIIPHDGNKIEFVLRDLMSLDVVNIISESCSKYLKVYPTEFRKVITENQIKFREAYSD